MLRCTKDAIAGSDFTELVEPNGGCNIPDTADRALSLEQLTRVINNMRQRLVQRCEVWATWAGDLTGAEGAKRVGLYDMNTYTILPATTARKCSMMELMSARAQPPDFFVSQ